MLKTRDGTLNAQHATIELKNKDGLTVQTEGGVLQLSPLISDISQPVTLQTGEGIAYLQEISGKVSNLNITSGEINLDGKLEAGSIFMEAEQRIKYGHLREGVPIVTTVKSSGKVTLNSKNSDVGTAAFPINIETTDALFVGARSAAYLKGSCAGGYAHVYEPNPPPLTVFNGHETYYVFLPKSIDENENHRTIAPALAHRLPTRFIHGMEMKPRHAPIYYDTADKD